MGRTDHPRLHASDVRSQAETAGRRRRKAFRFVDAMAAVPATGPEARIDGNRMAIVLSTRDPAGRPTVG